MCEWVLGLSLLNGLLSNIVLGVVVSVCSSVMWDCCLLDKDCIGLFVILFKLIEVSIWIIWCCFLCLECVVYCRFWVSVKLIFLVMFICLNKKGFWNISFILCL